MAKIDSQTLQSVIDDHGAALVLYAQQWCRAAEDAVQEAFIELLRAESVPDHILGWLYTTVRRRAMNLSRSEDRRTNHQRQATMQRRDWFVSNAEDFDEPIDYQYYLMQLPRLEREIIVARIWGGQSFAQISELVDQPLSTVHRRFHRALSELETLLNESEKTCETK